MAVVVVAAAVAAAVALVVMAAVRRVAVTEEFRWMTRSTRSRQNFNGSKRNNNRGETRVEDIMENKLKANTLVGRWAQVNMRRQLSP